MDKTKTLKSISVKGFRFKSGDLSKHLNVKNKQTAEIRGRVIVFDNRMQSDRHLVP